MVECTCGFCQLMFDRKPLDSTGAAVCSSAAAGQTADEVASSEPIC